MKTLGLIGGMSWESSTVYYSLINKLVKKKLGGYHSCKSILLTVDFAEIEILQRNENWKELDQIMVESAQQLEKAGADILIICTNTMHLCSQAITKNTNIPLLHIADAVGQEIIKKKLKKVALLGTKFTMEKDFYKTYLRDNFAINTIIPGQHERTLVHNIIYKELVNGQINEESREIFKTIISGMKNEGAEGVILGCTEIPLLISSNDVSIPVFDSTSIHAERAVDWVLNNATLI